MSDSDDVNKLQETVDRLTKRVQSLEKTLYEVTVYLQHQAKSKEKPVSPAEQRSEPTDISSALHGQSSLADKVETAESGYEQKPVHEYPEQAQEEPVFESTPPEELEPVSESDSPGQEWTPTQVRQKDEPSFTIPDYMKKSEFWLNKIGIGLILFSVVFAFKYSIDKGWITPPVRVLFGIAVGLVLGGFGLKIYKNRRHFSLVLLGGSIATFYISDFAAFQLFNLVSHPVAFGGMVVVTILSYALALRQNEPILSIIGILGGLGTPFLLYTGQGNIPGLILYTCILIAASCAIYFFKGWRLLLIITVLGGWTVFFVTQINGLPVDKTQAIADRWALQYGLITVWLLYWLVPLMREALAQIKPDSWAYPPLLMGGKPIAPEIKKAVDRYVHTLCLSTPIIVLAMSTTLWDISDTTWGWVCLIASLVYGVVTFLLYINKVKSDLVYTNGLIGILLFTISLSLILDGPTSMITIGTEAFILFLIARKVNDKLIAAYSHILFVVLAFVVIARIFLLDMFGGKPDSFFNKDLIADCFVTGFVFAVGFISDKIKNVRVYIIAGFSLLTGILCRELSGAEHLVALTVVMTGLFIYLRYRPDIIIHQFGRIFNLLMAIWVVKRIFTLVPRGTPFFNSQAGPEILFIAVLFAFAFLYKIKEDSQTHFIGAYLLLSGLFLRELTGNAEMVALSLTAASIFGLVKYRYDKVIEKFGLLYLLGMICLTFYRLVANDQVGSPFINSQALADIFLLAIAFSAIILEIKSKEERITVGALIHIGILMLLYRELSTMPNYQGFVTSAWGAYAIILMIIGLRKDIVPVRIAALLTLFLVVAKLFLIDLNRIDAIWRVLLFLAFGGIFLLLSYYFRKLWKNKEVSDETQAIEEDSTSD